MKVKIKDESGNQKDKNQQRESYGDEKKKDDSIDKY